MTRQLAFVIAFLGTGILLIEPAGAATPLQCEDQAVNCEAKCADVTGGAGDVKGHQNRCNQYCARQVSSCLSNAFVRSNASIRPYQLHRWDQ